MRVFNPSHSKILLTCGVGYDGEWDAEVSLNYLQSDPENLANIALRIGI
ncbi:hypothetical protein [Leptospira interrogans]|nr:hypothetical protein [Leptospira interrogans]